MPDQVKSRPYRSPLREQQADATRRGVLRAARELFAERGYAATPVADVARRAGVSVDTVYASVGRKPQLLLALHDAALAGGDDPVDREQRDYVAAVREAVGARSKLATYAGALAVRHPATAPLAEALRTAAATDPACNETWESLRTRRLEGMRVLAGELRATGDLRADLDDEEVALLLWTTHGPEYFLLATTHRSPEAYAAHLTDLWTRTLLA